MFVYSNIITIGSNASQSIFKSDKLHGTHSQPVFGFRCLHYIFFFFSTVRKIELWLRFEGSNVSNQQVHNFNCVVHLFRRMVIICIRCTECRVNRWSLYIHFFTVPQYIHYFRRKSDIVRLLSVCCIFVWHILGTISPVMSTMSAKSESRYVKFKMKKKNANKKLANRFQFQWDRHR